MVIRPPSQSRPVIRPAPSTLSGQAGATLLAGLIFLTILTLIGVTAARVSSLEERMAGNLRDRAVAMQAAEMALRDAERDISNLGTGTRGIAGITQFVADCGASSTGDTTDDGLCYAGPDGYASPSATLPSGFTAPVWKSTVSGSDIMTVAPSVAYGAVTGADAIPLVFAQPRYLIEGIRKTPPGSGESFYYRITTRAQGVSANTVVMVQEIYKP